MIRARPRLVGLAIGLAAAGTTIRASAESSVEYKAPPSCPTEDDVAARITAHRSPGDRTRIGIEQNGQGGYHGELVVVGSDGVERVRRAVDAHTCGAVVEAIALVAALAPRSSESEDGAASPASPPPSSEPEGPPPPSEGSTERAPDPAATPVTIDAPARVTVSREHATRFVVGATPFSGTTFGADRLMIGFGGFAEADSGKRLFGAALLQPSARLAIGGTLPTRSGDRTLDWGSCSDCGPQVRLVTLAIDLCPIGAGHHDRFGFAMCMHNEIGSIVARAGNRTDSDTRLWGAIGPIARGRFVANAPRGGVTEPGAIFVELSGGGIAPLRRDAFYFFDIGSAFLTPTFLWTFGIGVGVVVQ